MSQRSQVNPDLTLHDMITKPENKYFDRKSARIKPSDLADLISAFANAEGGTIVIGISDKSQELEGINFVGEEKINTFITAPKDYCKPMPSYQEEFLDVVNTNGEQDRILLLHIHATVDQIIRTTNDSTYLRIGDKTKEVKGTDLRNLEYSKSTRHYEDECNLDAEIGDLDTELIEQYKQKIGAEGLPTEQVLRARGFLKKVNGRECLTNAAVLLFAKNIYQFYPNCRIRFVRYEGMAEQVGQRINIIKDIDLEYPILRLLEKAKEYVSMQLRDFTVLEPDGKFRNVPEYPEFAWLEGIVNAVTHREYALSGDYIKVAMFDDRLEIQSPGKLPNIVTVENIRETRYSRNPRMARVLTSFGWVRELNEGVKRIYSDMADFFLDEPVYTEPEQNVKLVLKNNIVMRARRQEDRAESIAGDEVWNSLDELEKTILIYMSGRQKVTTAELVKYTGKSRNPIRKRLNHLSELDLVKSVGVSNDPSRCYELILD